MFNDSAGRLLLLLKPMCVCVPVCVRVLMCPCVCVRGNLLLWRGCTPKTKNEKQKINSSYWCRVLRKAFNSYSGAPTLLRSYCSWRLMMLSNHWLETTNQNLLIHLEHNKVRTNLRTKTTVLWDPDCSSSTYLAECWLHSTKKIWFLIAEEEHVGQSINHSNWLTLRRIFSRIRHVTKRAAVGWASR